MHRERSVISASGPRGAAAGAFRWGPPGRYGGGDTGSDRRLTRHAVTTTPCRPHRADQRPRATGTDAASVTTGARRRSAQ